MKFKIIVTIFFVICTTLAFYNNSFTSSGTPPSQKTGSSLGGGSTCSSCHSGGNGSGSVSSIVYYAGTTNLATSYVPGCSYDITIAITGTGTASSRGGFEMDALAGTVGAGTFSLTHPQSDPLHTQIFTLGANGACEVSHKTANSATNQWYVRWTAPATSVGTVTFYLAGVYGNGSGSGGDDVSTTQFTLTPHSVAPIAGFTITPNDTVCVGTPVSFNDASTNNGAVVLASQYFFGTGAGFSPVYTSIQSSVSKTYLTAGTYRVIYTLSTDNPITSYPCTFDTIGKTLVVINYPNANFTSTVNPGCPGGVDTIKLSNYTAGVSYTPGFGTATQAGSPPTAHGPWAVILPTSTGNVNYTMVATGFGCSSPASTATTQVQSGGCAKPTISFSIDSLGTTILPTNYCNNTYYTINDNSSANGGTLIKWEWDFTGPVFQPSPSHYIATNNTPFNVYFPKTGIYTARLILTDSRGMFDTVSTLVSINPCGPVIMKAEYSSSPNNVVTTGAGTASLSVCKGDVIQFTDNSTGAVISNYKWIWGDATPNGTNVMENHAYANAGTFTMKYIVDSLGLKFDTLITTVTVNSVAIANAGRDSVLCPTGASITLGSASTVGMTYNWQASNSLFVPSFSNPTISPTISGTYYLTVTNGSGSCQSTDSVYIGIDVIPTFNIAATPTQPCQNNQITVSCTPTNLSNYVFSFGGLNNPVGSGAGPYLVSWSDTGKHCITATAKTAFGCAVSSATPNTCIRVINCLAPIPSFIAPPQPICEGATVTFTDATQNNPTSWAWTFISPDTINYPANPKFSSLQNPNVTLPKPGKYYIYLNAYNQAGPAVNIYYDSIIVYFTPTATFGVITPVCENYNTFLTYTGNAATSAIYNWTFGGGASAGIGQGPISVKYNLPGTKQLTLQVIENGCPSATEATSVTVVATPVAAFSYNNIGPNYSFINKSSGAATYTWSFGDGQTSTTQHPIHSYTANGTFQVTLVAVKGNCSDDTTMALTAIVNGINDVTENNLFQTYFDKTNNNLQIKWLTNISATKHIEVLNMNGQLVYKADSKAEQINISTHDFSSGIYIVKCNDENGNSATKKWLKD
ncbi:MAG: hypothetical protein RIQ33_2435 [Bacteroidota bacterium]|jgi:PKD repeat protein